MTPAAPAQRLDGADVLRAVATIAVVCIHASYWPREATAADVAVWPHVGQLSRFAVPAFVVLSGLLLGYREIDRRPGFGWLQRRLRRAVLPFAVWAPVYFVLGARWFGGTCLSWWHTPSCGSGMAFLDWLTFGSAGHLWFLLLVPQLYVVFLLCPPRLRSSWAVVGGALALQLTLQLVRMYVPADAHPANWWALDYGAVLSPFWVGYFAVGVAAGERVRRHGMPRIPLWAAAAATAVTAALLLAFGRAGAWNPPFSDGTGGFLVPLMLPFALALSALLLGPGAALVRTRLRPPLAALSRHSLGIYIVHPIVLNSPGLVIGGHVVLESAARAGFLHDLVEGHDVTDTALGIVPLQPLGFVLLVGFVVLVSWALVAAAAWTPLAPLLGEQRRRIARRERPQAAAAA